MFDVIYDNGGAGCLQTPKGTIYHTSASALAEDIHDIIIGDPDRVAYRACPDSITDRIDYDAEAERRGDYSWVAGAEVLDALNREAGDWDRYLESLSGGFEKAVMEALRALHIATVTQQ